MTTRIAASGGCLCGNIRHEAAGPLVHSLVCHCRMCQRASGSAFMGLMFVSSNDLRLTKGETRTYGSSTTGIRHFCGDCGSSLFFERVSSALHGILVGSLDDPDLFDPKMHICLSGKQRWVNVADDVPCHLEKPEGMTPPGGYDSITGRLIESPSA